MTMNTTAPRVLGCDVSRDEVVVHDSRSGATSTVANGFAPLLALLMSIGEPSLVVCEATGGYEMALLSAARQAGLDAHRGDPRKISAFLRSLHAHAKTDPIDARGLARYGRERHDRLTRWQPQPGCVQALRDLVRLRADLVADCAGYARRLKAPGTGAHTRHIAWLIARLQSRIRRIEAEIADLIAADPELDRRARIIEAIPGCGKVTAMTLCAEMPELGHLSRRQAAALSGTAPHPRTSGNRNAYRRVRGGRPTIKSILFMAALAAMRWHPGIKAFALRLRQNGKKPIVIATAAARKLITIINAVIRDEALTRNLS